MAVSVAIGATTVPALILARYDGSTLAWRPSALRVSPASRRRRRTVSPVRVACSRTRLVVSLRTAAGVNPMRRVKHPTLSCRVSDRWWARHGFAETDGLSGIGYPPRVRAPGSDGPSGIGDLPRVKAPRSDEPSGIGHPPSVKPPKVGRTVRIQVVSTVEPVGMDRLSDPGDSGRAGTTVR
jgi:hypothetical protein